jgi:glycosyltransferase involved in cell wall biosynthesis
LGGGELAAYNLFKALKEREEVEEAWFLARTGRDRPPTGRISLRRPNEYLWEQAIGNWQLMKAQHQESLTTWFADLVTALKPTVIFAHHYAHLGLEYLRIIKQLAPEARIVMTLHEYMAICAHDGQMVKAGSLRLCYRDGFDDCHSCFPDRSPEDFWLRKHYFTRSFELVDMFVAPSEFLRERYISWGIAPERMVVIENGQASANPLSPRSLGPQETRNRFGFFGQINPFKGLLTLLEAMRYLANNGYTGVHLEVHGANLEKQKPEFQERVKEIAEPLMKEGRLHWMGPYESRQLPGRLAGVDWVTVPSTWWENSPMVIQEAFVYGRPVICSDIGGMAEKVRHNVDGYHVTASSIAHWAETLRNASMQTGEWERLKDGIRRPPSYRECAQSHLELLQGLESAPARKRREVVLG